MTRRIILGFILGVSVMSFAQNQVKEQFPQLNKTSVKAIIQAMSLDEKASMVVGTGLRFGGEGPVIGEADGKVPGAAGNTIGISRFGIPGTVLSDGPAGLRIDPLRKDKPNQTFYATAWPIGTLLASSWDKDLVERVGEEFGNEIKEYGVDVILGPGVNIHRDPLNGRNFEYYSEDPLVTGYIASALIKGIQSNGVGACIKHFAANNQETSRGSINTIVSERTLREIYLKGFEIAIKNSQPWTIMSAYNKINGVYCPESYDLLTRILRDEWGFKGYVMTDWYAGRKKVEQMKAGNDLIEPGGTLAANELIKAVKNGSLEEKVLDQNVERILNVILKTPSFNKYSYSEKPDLKLHAKLVREAASNSMVLLKNDKNVLPLKKGQTIALWGVSSYQTYIGGSGSGDVHEAYSIPISKGLAQAGYVVLDDLKNKYLAHLNEDLIAHPKTEKIELGTPRLLPEWKPDAASYEKSAKNSDVAIITIGRNAGEGGDRKLANDFNLSDEEILLIKNVASVFHANGKKVIVLLNIGGVVETSSWKNNVDGIILTWQPGQEAGNSVADVVSGVVNPSGKLTTTFPVKYEDVPSAKNFPGTPLEKPSEVVYEEGIYVGYRYYSTFDVKTSFPFGYGLSYTSFKYSNLKLSSTSFNGEMRATVTITNSGKVAGKEVIQLYLTAPVKSLDKPIEELKGFAKTNLLEPGASQTITFILRAHDLSSFNSEQSAWIADAGKYIVKIGASSEDIKLKMDFTLSKDMVVEKVNRALAPQVDIKELKNTKKN